jgi:hypothetical protein
MNKGKHSELGEVYTPDPVIKDIIQEIISGELSPNTQIGIDFDKNEIWLEPSMGDGRLLVAVKKMLLKKGFAEKDILARLYGVEINPESCQKAVMALYGPGELSERTNPNAKVRKWHHSVWGDIDNLVCTDSFSYSFNFSQNTKIHGFDWLSIDE